MSSSPRILLLLPLILQLLSYYLYTAPHTCCCCLLGRLPLLALLSIQQPAIPVADAAAAAPAFVPFFPKHIHVRHGAAHVHKSISTIPVVVSPSFLPASSSSSSSSSQQQQQQEQQEQEPQQLKRSEHWIVLVDDSESIRNSVGQFLFDAGYTVTACADAEALIELLTCASSSSSSSSSSSRRITTTTTTNLHPKLPSVILCDVRMPGTTGGMNGLELLHLLKNPHSSQVRVTRPSRDLDFVRQQWRRIPVVMLTAKSMTQDRIEGYRKGADVYLPKPFAPEELLSIVDNLIRRMKCLGGGGGTSTKRRETLRDVKEDILEVKSMLLQQNNHNHNHNKINQRRRDGQPNNRLLLLPASSPDRDKSQDDNNENDNHNKSNHLEEMTRMNDIPIQITNVDQQILILLSQGKTNGEIAEAMGVTLSKVSRRISHMYLQTFTKTRTELVRWAMEAGYVPILSS